MHKRIITAILTLSLLMGAITAQAFLLTLDNQDLSGTPGSHVGWGFSLLNDSSFDLYVTGVSADGTLYGAGGASALGTFLDDISVGGGIVVPSMSTSTGSFPASSLASFVIKPTVPVGAEVTGKINLDYELYDINSDFQGAGILTAQYNNHDALASVTTTAVPEPSTYVLLALSLGAVGFARKRINKA